MSGSLPPFTNPIAEQFASGSFQDSAPFDPSVGSFDLGNTGRRGPRPAVEPAANPKRQKNREAQRAHRERKERYVKDLEYEAARLRQHCVQLTGERDVAIHQRDALYQETQQLREIIESLKPSLRPKTRVPSLPHNAFAPSQSLAASSGSTYAPSTTMPGENWSQTPQLPVTSSFESEASSESAFTTPGTGTLDYDAIALDFVLGLERPCMEHAQYLVSRAHESNETQPSKPSDVPDDGENEEISGHAMMATCPSPFPLQPLVSHDAGFQLPQMNNSDLTRLLGLSDDLPGVSETELPIIKAWARLRGDDRFPRLSAEDFQNVQRQLMASVNCYRFGSVVSADQLEQAINTVCKTPAMMTSGKLS